MHNSPTKTIVPKCARSFNRIVQNERKRLREAWLHAERAVVADSFGLLSVLAVENHLVQSNVQAQLQALPLSFAAV